MYCDNPLCRFWCFCYQRHTRRDMRPSTAACPAFWATRTKALKKCTVRKKTFCTGPNRAAKAEQKSLVPARQAQRTNQERTPFICTLWVPVHLSLNSQQGPPISSLSARYYYLNPNVQCTYMFKSKAFLRNRPTALEHVSLRSIYSSIPTSLKQDLGSNPSHMLYLIILHNYSIRTVGHISWAVFFFILIQSIRFQQPFI